MNRMIFAFLISVMIFFSSCSQNQSSDIVYLNEDTLKTFTEEKENSVQWTRELESARLLRDISKHQAVSDSVKLSPLVMCVTDIQYFEKDIYPFLPGFGSLDISSVSNELRSFLDDFCKSVSLWLFDESKVEPYAVFSFALFKFDLETKWKLEFGSEFPLENSNGEKTDSSETTSETKENSSETQVFSNWIYGEPFFDEDNIQIPVRFYCEKGSVDVVLYSSKENFKISQIQIQKWNKN